MAHYVRVSSFDSWIRGYLTPMTDRKSTKKGNNVAETSKKRAKVLYRDLRDDFPDTKDAYDTFVDRSTNLIINAAYVHHHNPKNH